MLAVFKKQCHLPRDNGHLYFTMGPPFHNEKKKNLIFYCFEKIMTDTELFFLEEQKQF